MGWGHYILEGRKTARCANLTTWARWMESADRQVADAQIGDLRVSTVFLGLDHSHGIGPPLLFETMVFGSTANEELTRCTTYEQAVAMHNDMVEYIRGAEQKRMAGARAIRDALISDVETMTDEEMRAELVALGEDPDALAKQMRADMLALVAKLKTSG